MLKNGFTASLRNSKTVFVCINLKYYKFMFELKKAIMETNITP